jgi:hypothetical protein
MSEASSSETCKFVLLSGARKNLQCDGSIVRNSGYCSRHIRKVKILSIDSLPADVILYLARFMDGVSMYQFSQSTNFTKHVFSNSYSDKIWKEKIDELDDEEYAEIKGKQAPPLQPSPFAFANSIKPEENSQGARGNEVPPPKRVFQLMANRGCEECGKIRIRKIYWPFAKRLCRRCLQNMTISDYRLKTDYNIPSEFWPNNCQNVQLWNKYVGVYELRFFLISEVEAKFGKTLKQITQEKYDEYKRKNNLAFELTKWTRQTFSNKNRVTRCKTYSEAVKQIMGGNVSSLLEVLTKNFTSELSAEYQKLRKEEQESSRERRKLAKTYQEFFARLEKCSTYEDWKALGEDVRTSELSTKQIYMIEAEIWRRSRRGTSVTSSSTC